MRNFIFVIIFFLVANIVDGQTKGSLEGLVNSKSGKKDFFLASGDVAADILIDEHDSKTVKLVAGLFADDVERVTGLKPEIKNKSPELSKYCVIVGTIEGSKFIQDLIVKNKIDVSDIEGEWESCLVQVVEKPFRGVKRALVVAGSDRRGTAYAMLELSKQMGVSPWYDFADVPVQKKAFRNGTLEIEGSTGTEQVNLSLFNPKIPAGIQFEGYVESNGYISLEAEHFSHKRNGEEAEWRIIEGLGRTGSSVTVLPFTAKAFERIEDIENYAPVLEYQIYTFSAGEFPVEFNCIPSHSLNENYGVRLAIALDDNDPEIVSNIEKRDVGENLMKLTSGIQISEPGPHTLKIFMVDPGVTLDKIVIQTGEVKNSYLGPPESKFCKF